MSKYDKEWLYEKQAMQKRYAAVIKKRIAIRDIPDGDESIAYTSDEPAIYLKKDSKFTKGLDEHKARAFRFGVFTREMLKQHFTNYKYINEISDGLEAYEVPVFKLICDTVESAVMEVVAPSLIGGFILNSLRYSCKRIYDEMEDLDTAKTPLQEFLLAMEQVTTIGKLKGTFKTPAAKTVYYRSHIKLLDAVEELDDKKRIDLCLEIHNISKPLWEVEAKEAYDLSSKSSGLESLLGTLGWMLGGSLSFGSGSSSKVDPEELEELADFSKGGYRETAYHDVNDLSEEEREAYEKEKEAHEKMREEMLLARDEEEEDNEIRYASGSGYDRDNVFYDKTDAGDLSTIYDYDPEEDEIDAKGCDYFDNLIRTELEIQLREDIAASTTALAKPLDLPEISTKYSARNYQCKNLMVNLTERSKAVEGYNKVVSNFASLINNCVNKLKVIFAEDAEETVYRSSGKLSLKRSMSGTVTSKMFTKKLDPKDKSNMAVELVIDESGSMSGTRIYRAKTTAICLAEVFKKLHIPLYIMGFTADTGGADVLHTHYAMWSGATADLLKLTTIQAKANNFDGYSIRYASRVLERRSEAHKVLIIISDGQPACDEYSGDKGLRDTRDAISEARNKGQIVLGIAIGADIKALQEMYGTDFIYINEEDDLFSGIMNKFTDIVKAW